jgi:hypothetical protein
MPDHGMTIRSFGVVFDIERRIHKIDRFRIPLPYGLPLRSLGYAVGAVLIIISAGHVPLLGAIVGALPAPLRFVAVPCAMAYALTSVRIDGRVAHVFGVSVVRYAVSPRCVARCAPVRRGAVRLGDATFAPDEHTALLRPGRVTGPARLHVRSENPRPISLQPGEHVVVR